jgi:hypothetical protein
VPHRAQKPRWTPGDDAKIERSWVWKVTWSRLNPTKVAMLEAVWRRQLAQWQWTTHSGSPSLTNLTRPQRHPPLCWVMFRSNRCVQ